MEQQAVRTLQVLRYATSVRLRCWEAELLAQRTTPVPSQHANRSKNKRASRHFVGCTVLIVSALHRYFQLCTLRAKLCMVNLRTVLAEAGNIGVEALIKVEAVAVCAIGIGHRQIDVWAREILKDCAVFATCCSIL